MMSGVNSPSSERHGDTVPPPEGSDVVLGDRVRDLDLSQCRSLSNSSSLEPNGEEIQQDDGSWSQDEDLEGRGQLDRKWLLWHEFMKEHAHLDAWLRLAEQAVTPQKPAHFTYTAAKEELKKFERLRGETQRQLVQLDGLTRRNQTLTQLFEGAMRARLLVSARECGRRWDVVNDRLESISGRLQLFVSEWEEFEAQREELGLWLADMDVRLTEVDQLTGNSCQKLKQLQSFQQCVGVNSGRVNTLLLRGEALIQCSDPSDAQHVESRLLELLRRCSHVYDDIERTHTRLLSMKLVFEDDWILSQASDSGCPSESVLEEEGAFDKLHLDLHQYFRQSVNSALDFPSYLPSPLHHPPPPNSPSSPTHEHLGLEWDPSVDIGRSVSHDDSSYFSASTGLCHRDGLKRRSYLSSFDSLSDVTNDIIDLDMDLGLQQWLDHAPPTISEVTERAPLCRDQWTPATPDRPDGEPVGFDRGRVKAWLGVQSSAPLQRRTSCSKAVQTDEMKHYTDGRQVDDEVLPHLNSQRYHDNTHDPDVKACCDWLKLTNPDQSDVVATDESSCCEASELSMTSSSRACSPLLSPALLILLLFLLLLICLIWFILEPPCHRSNRMPRTFHLALRYINGPPPT